MIVADDQRTTEEILDEAKSIQAKSKESTTRSKAIVQEITETGNATLEQLQQDRNKLEEVHNDLEEMDSDLKMAQNQLKGIARKLSKDNLIRYALLATLFVLILLFYHHFKAMKLTSTFSSLSLPPMASDYSGLCILACLIILVAIIVVIVKRKKSGGGKDST